LPRRPAKSFCPWNWWFGVHSCTEGDNPLNGLAHHPGRATLAASLAAQPPALDFAQRDYKVLTAMIGWSPP
jgi:hypothetical protein